MGDKEETERTTDSVSDQEQEIAQNALNEFKKKNYNACLQYINKLDHRTNDFKVAHNKALVEYCKSDSRKSETFQKALRSICNQFRIKVEGLDDIDQCIIQYNQAVLLYHQKQYTAAIQVMDRVYKFIEPMDDTLARQVSLFNIELQLCIRQPEKALSLINYLENHLINGTPSIKILDKSVKEKDKKVQPPLNPAVEEFRKKLMKYKIRCYLMSRNLDIACTTLKAFSKDKSNVNAVFFNANLEYLKGNFVESQKILTSIRNDCLVYNECGESFTVMFYNNMGIIHHAMGKPNLACHYFQMALKEDISTASVSKKDLNERPLHTLGGSKYHELMYNLGISLLHAKRPAQAFDCLITAVRRFHRNSRLWMRLAECCIMVNKESNEIDFDMEKKQKEIVLDVIGSRENQKVILTSSLSKDKKYSTESQSYAVPVPSLEFASLSLRNAYNLLPSDTASAPVLLFLIPGITPPVSSPSPGPAPSSPLSCEGIASLRNSILAASAYVTLCLGDYILALEHARNLLSQPHISSIHKFLGHLYCAEALVLLDQISEALDHLDPENVKDLSFDLSLKNEEKGEGPKIRTAPPVKWFPDNLSSAHATMHYNIAVAKTIRGQFDEAIVILKQVWHMNGKCKVPGYIVMLVLYIELQSGLSESARNLIKQNLHQNKMTY